MSPYIIEVPKLANKYFRLKRSWNHFIVNKSVVRLPGFRTLGVRGEDLEIRQFW